MCGSHGSGDIMVNDLDKILLSWKHWRVVCKYQDGWVGEGSLRWVVPDLSEDMTTRLYLRMSVN